MISLKRTIGFLVAAVIVGTSIPAQSANQRQVPSTNRALITASPYYVEFNPANGPARITLSVTGATALDVRVRVFKTHRQVNLDIACDDNPYYFVANLVPPYSQLGQGSHVVSWSGMMTANNPANSGAYCYRADWTNNAAGVRNMVEGVIMVNNNLPVTRRANNNGGNNNTGRNNPGTAVISNGRVTTYPQTPVESSTGVDEPSNPDLTCAVTPHDIYPESREPSHNTALIAYQLRERLPRGLKVAIRDGNNVEIRVLSSTTGRQDPITTSKPWNGRSNLTGRVYPAGVYSAVFTTNGAEITRCPIRVHMGSGPTGGTIIDNGDTSSTTSGDISVRVHPTTIYPASNNPNLNTTQLDYRVLSTLSRGLSILIYSPNNSLVRTLKSDTGVVRPVSTSVSWNGRYLNGSIVPYGSYRYVFKSGGAELASGYIRVSPLNNPNPNPRPNPNPNPNPRFAPVITDYGPNPSSFVQGGSTNFRFQVSQAAKVTLKVYKNNTRVATLLDQTSVNTFVTKSVPWSTNTVGTYTYTIEASNSNGRAQSKSGTVRVTQAGNVDPCANNSCNNGSNMDVSAVSVAWNPVTPILNFSLNQPGYVRVRVYPVGNAVSLTSAITVTDNQLFGTGTHQFNLTSASFPIGYSYSVEVYARSQRNNTTDTEYTTVNQNNTPVPTGCGSFRDVPVGHPMCAAINFVVSRGIFAGYPDGTLGLNRPIQRAEFLAVVQKGFRFNLEPYSSISDGALGYRDLYGMVNQWFMPYVKTFSRLNVMVGYPDHTMLPAKTIGTAEFLVSFFQAAEKSPYAITRFRVNREVDHAPYADTPVNQDTYWYIGYAAFARMHDLIPGGYMYPGRGITRGQVIDFIYQTYLKGVIGYGADILNPTYPQQTYQDYYNFNNSPTAYPYNAPVIDNNYNNNTYYDGYAQSQGYYDPNQQNYNDPYSYGYNNYENTPGSSWQWM